MNKRVSERRMAENEVVFRRRNQRMQQDFTELKKIAVEDGQERTLNELDVPLYFYCECSDENCQERLLIQPSNYNNIHQRNDMFVVAPGHEVDRIEKVVTSTPHYCIVRKFEAPRLDATELMPTDVHNV